MSRHRRFLETIRREMREGTYRDWGLDEDETFDVEVHVHDTLLPTEEPNDGIISFSAELKANNQVVGTLQGYLVDTDRADINNVAYFDFFDAHSQTLYDYGSRLFDLQDEQLNAETMQALGWTDEPFGATTFIIIDGVEIIKKWQGKRLGALFVDRVLEMIGKGYSFVAIEPFPMQFGRYRDSDSHPPDERARAAEWRSRHLRDDFATSKAAATRRIAKYWKQHGFVRVGRSSIWVRPLCKYDA